MTLLQKLRAGQEGLFRKLASFGVIGALNFVVDTAIFNLLFRIGPVKAQVVATIVATTVSYFLNRHWTFKGHSRAGLRREYILFFVLNGVGLAITAAIVGIAKYGFDTHEQLALNIVRLFAIAVATLFRFWSYQRWVFMLPAPDEPALVAPLSPAEPAPAVDPSAAETSGELPGQRPAVARLDAPPADRPETIATR